MGPFFQNYRIRRSFKFDSNMKLFLLLTFVLVVLHTTSACKPLDPPDNGSIKISETGNDITAKCNDGYVPEEPFASSYTCFGWWINIDTTERVTSLPNCVPK